MKIVILLAVKRSRYRKVLFLTISTFCEKTGENSVYTIHSVNVLLLYFVEMAITIALQQNVIKY